MKGKKGVHLQLSLDVYVNQYGEICTVQDDTVLTKPYLEIALKYSTEQQLAEKLNVSVEIIEKLKEIFDIQINSTDRLTKERIKIMEIIQRYNEKYGAIPPMSYLRKRSKFTLPFIQEQINILVNKRYLSYDRNGGVKILRAV